MRPLAEEEHLARPGREDAEAAGEQRGLAAARRAQQPVDAARRHIQRQPLQHGHRLRGVRPRMTSALTGGCVNSLVQIKTKVGEKKIWTRVRRTSFVDDPFFPFRP